jgi:hypothetical protein
MSKDILETDVQVNDFILEKYREQHFETTDTTHWHTGNQTDAKLRNIVPENLKPANLIYKSCSRIIYLLLKYELKKKSYPLASGITKGNYVDPCFKIYPLQNLKSNYLICKSYVTKNNNKLKTNFSISIFFQSAGYVCTIKGISKPINYKTNLNNTNAKEAVYLLNVNEISISFVDLVESKVKTLMKNIDTRQSSAVREVECC